MNETINPPERRLFSSADWLAAILAFALIALLFPIARTRLASGQPWRAEMLTTLFLFVSIVVLNIRDKKYLAQVLTFKRPVGSITVLLAGFTMWSLFSAIWAHSAYSAWHHTLVWIEYILFFLFVRENLERTQKVRFITGTFLWLSGIIGILCLLDYATLPDFKALEGILRARYSSYAELLVTALPIVWITAIYQRKRKDHYFITLIAIVGWTAAMLSLSKGAFIAGVIGFLITFLGSLVFSFSRFRSRIVISAAIWAALTLGVQIGFSILTPIPATVDYISGKADPTRQTSTARIFVWKVGKQMAIDHWLSGVGADNFGVSFNESRAKYRVSHPDDPKDETVSDNVVERAHNEALQIFAELGVIGVAILLLALGLSLLYFIRGLAGKGFRASPMFWAALGGMSAFAVSSMVSSFSLRLVQNGIVFFIVFAFALYETKRARDTKRPRGSFLGRFSFALVLFVMIAMLATHSLKAVAEYNVFRADRETDTETALGFYRRAVKLDPDYNAAYLRSAGRSFQEKNYGEAAKNLQVAINDGLGVVITYSALADCETKIGDRLSAEKTFAEALRIFPRSVFLRVRYALFLSEDGRMEESDKEMSTARGIDVRQANGWLNLLTIGSTRSFYAAQSDKDLALPAELLPAEAVLQYLDKLPSDSTH